MSRFDSKAHENPPMRVLRALNDAVGPHKAGQIFRRPTRHLEGYSPEEFAKTSAGARAVLLELPKIIVGDVPRR
jgi:hypothetical protein